MEESVNRFSNRNLLKKLKILSLTSQYLRVLSLLMFLVPDQNLLSTHIENHNIDTR